MNRFKSVRDGVRDLDGNSLNHAQNSLNSFPSPDLTLDQEGMALREKRFSEAYSERLLAIPIGVASRATGHISEE